MAACCASLGSGRRPAGGVRGRSVGAEPMKGGAVHGVDARGLVGERGLGDGLLTLHVYLPVSKILGGVRNSVRPAVNISVLMSLRAPCARTDGPRAVYGIDTDCMQLRGSLFRRSTDQPLRQRARVAPRPRAAERVCADRYDG